jgi:hypothetical protein
VASYALVAIKAEDGEPGNARRERWGSDGRFLENVAALVMADRIG